MIILSTDQRIQSLNERKKNESKLPMPTYGGSHREDTEQKTLITLYSDVVVPSLSKDLLLKVIRHKTKSHPW